MQRPQASTKTRYGKGSIALTSLEKFERQLKAYVASSTEDQNLVTTLHRAQRRLARSFPALEGTPWNVDGLAKVSEAAVIAPPPFLVWQPPWLVWFSRP